MAIELTDAQHAQLVSIITLWEPAGRPPTREQIHEYHGTTPAAVARNINALEAAGAVTVTWSATENDEVITPTNEGRAAL